jgi:murein DD-endopeptidase MepM/ murein hydrolase activator NlpD
VFEAIQGLIDAALVAITDKNSEQWIQVALDYFSSGAVDVLAQGAERGGYMNMGVRMAVNNQMQGMGGRELSPEEGQLVMEQTRLAQKEELKTASFYDKYFNMYDSRSTVAKLFDSAPKNREQTIAAIQRLPATLGSTLLNLFGSKKVQAQGAYDYGFPLYGYSTQEENDPRFDNPYENEAYMLEGDRLTRMNAEYGKECFFMEASADGTLTFGEAGNFMLIPDKCSDTSNEELLRYRFYLADLISAHTMACYEGDDDSCNQLYGIGGAAAPADGAATPPGGNASGPYVNPLQGSSYRCTSGFGPRWGTKHEGVDMALPVGNPVLAPTAGTVKRAGPSNGYGLVVVIQGDDGMHYELGHISSYSVKVGDRVAAGAEVAKSGNTGQSTGPHLHFSVATGFFTGRIDPEVHMASRGVTLCP